VAFGRVLQGMDVVTVMENVKTEKDKPIVPVIIDDCGQLS
jgi:cyclophilin family peptidyl-prolyl cis-trans isomerase